MVSNPSSRNLKCILAYTGTKYFGFQKTKMGPSIEAELESALETILQHPIKIQAASRTDQGVHAEGQVINFFTHKDIDLSRLYVSMRGLLPKDISPLKVTEEKTNFHPTLDVRGKEYHYWVCNTPTQIPFHNAFSWHVYDSLNLYKMKIAATALIGSKDFSALTNEKYEDPIRTVRRIEIFPEGNRLRFEIEGDHFLYKMVRNIVGTLIHIGSGKIPLQDLLGLLEQKQRKKMGITAPAHGLFLKQVFY